MINDMKLNIQIKFYLFVACILELIKTILTIYLLLTIGKITDYVINKDFHNFVNLLPTLLILFIFQVSCFYAKSYLLAKVKVKYAFDTRNFIYHHIIHTSIAEKEKVSNGDILNLYNNKIEMAQEYLCKITGIFTNPIIIFAAIFYFSAIHLKLLIVACIFIPGASILYNLLLKPIQHKTAEILQAQGELTSVTEELLKGFYIMKAYNLQSVLFQRFKRCSVKVQKKEVEKDKMNAVLGRMYIVLRYIPQLIIPLYGGYLCFHNELSAGDFIVAQSLIWYIITPVEDLLSIIKLRRESRPAMQSIRQIYKWEPEQQGILPVEADKERNVSVFMDHLSFSYDAGSAIFHDFHFELKAKEHVAIIGESGSGKSTLFKLLCGLETKFTGELIINGIRMKKETIPEIRKTISYVPQTPYLFHDAISENIKMGKDAADETVIEAAKLTGLHDFIMSLPDKYNTVIGAGGVRLSGGQCKRLAIARAVINNGELFILDEVTSALDANTEKMVVTGLMNFCKDKSVLMITHTLQEDNLFDYIINLREKNEKRF